MIYIRKKYIDLDKTGKKLQALREHNLALRRKACEVLKRETRDCKHKCEECEYEMDNHISRKELADVFGVSENVIFNWESGRTAVGYEDLLFYSQLSELDVDDIVVFVE